MYINEGRPTGWFNEVLLLRFEVDQNFASVMSSYMPSLKTENLTFFI